MELELGSLPKVLLIGWGWELVVAFLCCPAPAVWAARLPSHSSSFQVTQDLLQPNVNAELGSQEAAPRALRGGCSNVHLPGCAPYVLGVFFCTVPSSIFGEFNLLTHMDTCSNNSSNNTLMLLQAAR
eukprot:1144673-Pelagomonas_calceolata.AAC.2